MKNVTLISPDFYAYGAMVIGGTLHDEGYNVEIRKEFDWSLETDVLGLSLGATMHLLDLKGELFKIKHGINPPLIIAGGSLSPVPELIFEYLPEVDFVVIGEGEETTPALLDAIRAGVKDLEGIEGIAFAHDGEVVVTGERKPFEIEKRSMPFIPPDLKHHDMRGVSTAIETHRGCGGQCTFCLAHQLFGSEIRSRPLEEIMKEIKLLKKHGIESIGLGLETVTQFGWDKGLNDVAFTELLKTVSGMLGAQNVKCADVRVDMVSEHALEAIRDYTAGYISFGIESGSNRILDEMSKGITVDRIIDAVEMARDCGIRMVIGAFITGYPGETEDDHEATKELIGELMLEEVFVNIASPIPGTALAARVRELDNDRNPVLMMDDTKIGKRHNLTVAERRMLELYLTAIAASPLPSALTDKKYKKVLSGLKDPSREAVLVTGIVKEDLGQSSFQ